MKRMEMTTSSSYHSTPNENQNQSSFFSKLNEETLPPNDTFSSGPSSNNSNNNNAKRNIRYLVLITLSILLVLVIIDLSTSSQHIQHWLKELLSWMEFHPYAGVLVFILVYALCTVLFIPGAILTIGCGFTFGYVYDTSLTKAVIIASTTVFLGASLGSIMAFLLGRYLFRDCVLNMAKEYPMFEAVDRALEHNGIKIMILLRLSPLIPYNALDFMSGITSISIASYSIALLGVLPGVVLYTFIGATASTLGDHDGDGMTGGGGGESQNPLVRKISLVFGILFAALGVSVAAYHANKELKKILEEQQQQQLEEETRHSLSSSHNEENLPEIT